MHCPFCNTDDTKVIDSRLVADGGQVRRRRECVECGERFTTYELAELVMPRVIKSDGSRQPFDEEKLRAGLQRALEKRPVSIDEVEISLSQIKHFLQVTGEREISSRVIGEEVMKKFEATKLNSIDEVLSQADFVSLHCPSTKETKGLINKETISKMKKSAYLINTARGDIVNENDLVEALKEEMIMGAGLDVYEKEPSVHKNLVQLKNVFLLPHLGSATTETREAMGMRVFENIQAFFNNKEPIDRVV